MIYEYLWRNKWLTSDAKTIDDMINMLQSAVDTLKEWKIVGVTLDPESGICDDYASLITEDETIADKYEFAQINIDDDDDDDDSLSRRLEKLADLN